MLGEINSSILVLTGWFSQLCANKVRRHTAEILPGKIGLKVYTGTCALILRFFQKNNSKMKYLLIYI